MGMSGTVRMVMTPACRPAGARSCTRPPTLVCAETSLSAGPLLRISRYATVVPGVVGFGTYALATAIDDVALADAHPVTTSAASRAAPAIRSTGVSLRTITGYSAGRGDDPPRPPWPDPPWRMVGSRPIGGGPRSSMALWKRWRLKPAPPSFLARSRRFGIVSLPQGYRPLGGWKGVPRGPVSSAGPC